MSECIKKNINKFIFMSSCSVYGNVRHNVLKNQNLIQSHFMLNVK